MPLLRSSQGRKHLHLKQVLSLSRYMVSQSTEAALQADKRPEASGICQSAISVKAFNRDGNDGVQQYPPGRLL